MEPNMVPLPLVAVTELAMLPLFDTVVFPTTVMPMSITQPQAVGLVDEAVAAKQLVGLIALGGARRKAYPDYLADCRRVGTAALMHRLLRLHDGTLRVAAEGLQRIAVVEWLAEGPYLRARVQPLIEAAGEPPAELVAQVARQAVALVQRVQPGNAELHAQLADERDGQRLAFLVASSALPHLPLDERQALLELPDATARLLRLDALLTQALSRRNAVRSNST
jgi:ATP-dependent Lon protease